MNNNQTVTDVCQINETEYFYKVILFNDEQKFVKLSQTAVKNLTISDNVLTPFINGSLIIDNSLDSLQRGFEEIDGSKNEALFDFNLSDIDMVYVEIIPKFFEDQKLSDLKNSVWRLKHTFVIDKINDIPMSDPELSIKELVLIDINEYLGNKSSKFSTANYSTSNKSSYLRDNEDRMLKTGDALKKIIQEYIPDSVIDEDWDEGKNSIFYTSPANDIYIDDMMNIYDIHQSDIDDDFCIMSQERSTGVWKFEKFSDISKKALDQNNKSKSGEYQMEAFIIAEGGNTKLIPRGFRVPTDYGFNVNTSFGDNSKIENFRMNEFSNADNNIKTVISHSYDFDDGKFRIEHYDVDDTVEYFQSKYSDKLRIGSFESAIPFNIQEPARKNERVEHFYTSLHKSENTLEFISRNKILQSACLLTLGLDFTITGMTNRQAGKFFSIRKENDYVPSEYENKLQGQWFCVSVEHVFSGSEYTNNIVGMKLNKLEKGG